MRALLVDDDRSFLESIESWADAYEETTPMLFTRAEDARRALERSDVSMVIADYRLGPGSEDGLSFIESVKKKSPSTEVVLLTGFPLSVKDHNRLRDIDAVVVDKGSLSEEALAALLKEQARFRPAKEEPNDWARLIIENGKLRLRVVELERQLESSSRQVFGETFSCFVSHSSRDESFARKLYGDLVSRGVLCYFAPEDMRAGDEIRPTVRRFVDRQEKLVLILSESSIASRWVQTEVEAAFSKERETGRAVLVPLRIDDAIAKADRAWAREILEMRHIENFAEWREEAAYQKALARLHAALLREER
jgi:ActR/RegA family two-component response regulator